MNLQNSDISILCVISGKVHIDQTLFPVNHRVLTVRRKSHDRNLTAVASVIFHIVGTGLLISSEQKTNSSSNRKPAVPERRQRIQCGNGRSFIIHGSPAKDFSVTNLTTKRIKTPSVPFRHHIQMSQNGYHLFSFAILAPAHLMIQIYGCKAKCFRRFQCMIQTVLHSFSIWILLGCFSLYASDPDAFLKAFQQLFFIPFHCFL